MVADPGRVPNVKAVGQNGFTLDMFGRLKTAHGVTIFDSQHRYKDNGDFSNATSGAGDILHNTNTSAVTLSVGTASGDKVTRESSRVFPYQPGKSLQVLQTFVLNAPKANLRQRVGYFSRKNGFYLEVDGSSVYLVKRSYSTGSVVETRVAQNDWNIETFTGEGPTDFQLDFSKAQILFTEIEWLGVGAVRVGFVINGVPVVAHRFDHANVVETTYMTTATLPVRYEIENTAATASASGMQQICTTVISNGGYSFDTTNINSAWRSSTASVGTTRTPLVAIRLRAGREDAVVIPASVSIAALSAGDGGWALIKNPTTLTGGTWVVDEYDGNVEYNVTATAIDGGLPVRREFASATNQSTSSGTTTGLGTWDLQLGRTNSDTPVSDVYVLTYRTLSGTMSVQGILGWYDLV